MAINKKLMMRLEKSAFKHYSSRLSPQAAPLLIENQLKKRNKERGCVVGGANQPTNQLSKKAHRHAVSVCDDQSDSSRSIVPAAAAHRERAPRHNITHADDGRGARSSLSLHSLSSRLLPRRVCGEFRPRERERPSARRLSVWSGQGARALLLLR